MAQFDVDAARKSGMRDEEILQFMLQNNLAPKMSAEGYRKNFFNSTGNMIGNTVKSVANIFNPDLEKNTIANLGRFGVGAVQNLIPGEQGGEKFANDVFRNYGQRYGVSNALRGNFQGAGNNLLATAYLDPAGTVMDAASLMTGAGAAAKGVGAVSKSSRVSSLGSKLLRAGDLADPMYQTTRLARKGVNRLVRNMDDFSGKYATAGIGNPAAVREANRMLKRIDVDAIDPVTGRKIKRPMTFSDLIREGNLYGRSVDDVVRYSDELSKTFDTIADNPRLSVSVSDITSPLDKLIESTRQAIKDFPGESSYKIQLKELTRQRKNLASKGSGGIIPGNEALRLRRTLEDVTSDAASRGVQLKPGEMLAKQKAVSGLRTGLRQADPRLTGLGRKMQAIGFDYPGKQGPVLKAFGGYESRSMARNPITLGGTAKIGLGAGLGAGAFGPIGALGGAMASGVVSSALSSPGGIRAVSRGGQRLAKGIGSTKRMISPYIKASERSVVRPSLSVNRSAEKTPKQQQQQPQLNNLPKSSPSFSFYNRKPKSDGIKLPDDYFTEEEKRRYGFK